MARRRQQLIGTAAVVVISLVLAPDSRSQVPPVPPLPVPLPDIDEDLAPLPPAQEKVRFRVVVEGTAVARAAFNGSGGNGLCSVSVDGSVEETTTFGRGKGLALEFSRFKGQSDDELLITRPGRKRDASFAVVATTRRKATGAATRSPLVPIAAGGCPATTEALPRTGTCGIPSFPSRPSLRFDYARGNLDIDVTSGSFGPRRLPADCPRSGIIELPGLPNLWPTPLPTRPGPLAVSRLFGKARAFKVVLRADVGPVARPYTVLAGPGTVRSTARHEMTVRFTRERVR